MVNLLKHTVLSVATTPDIISALESLGSVEERMGGSTLFEKDSEPGDFFVILEGVVFIHNCKNDMEEIVIGPGNILGEIAFFLGTRRTKKAVVGPDGCKVWRVSRKIINEPKNAETLILLTHLLLCMGSLVATRLHSLALKNGVYGMSEEKEVSYYCDHQHVAIRRMAEVMCVDDSDSERRDWRRAAYVWNYVRKIPFRFGKWPLRASVTLAMNGGDHLSKTNLQVALLRAMGLKASFVHARIRQDFFQFLQYQDQRLKTARIAPRNLADYYFCAVALGDQWVHCDANFPREVVKIIAGQVPQVTPLVSARFIHDHPYSLVDTLGGEIVEITDDLKITVFLEETHEVMESRNIYLDRVQNFPTQVPEWVRAVRRLLANDPENAFLRAYGSLVYDLKRFHQMIRIDVMDD